jgi:hypothetical protein
MLLMFLQVLQTYVLSVLAIFVRMLQVFHLDVSKVDLMLQQVFHIHVLRRILQVLLLNVSKVDWILHLSSHFSAVSHRYLFHLRRRLGICHPLPLFLDAGDARADAGPVWARETAQEMTYWCGRPDVLSIQTSRR